MNNPPYADDVDEEYTDDTDFEGEEEFDGEEGQYGDGSDGPDVDGDDDDGLVEEGVSPCVEGEVVCVRDAGWRGEVRWLCGQGGGRAGVGRRLEIG